MAFSFAFFEILIDFSFVFLILKRMCVVEFVHETMSIILFDE